MISLNNATKLLIVEDGVVAGTTAVETTAVPVEHFDLFRWILHMGAITAVALTRAYIEGSNDNGSTWAELEDTSITIADDDDGLLYLLEVYRPGGPDDWTDLRLVVSRGTQNAVVINAICELCLYQGIQPITQSITHVGGQSRAMTPSVV